MRTPPLASLFIFGILSLAACAGNSPAADAELGKKVFDELGAKLSALSLLRPGVTRYWTTSTPVCEIHFYGLLDPVEIDSVKASARAVLKSNPNERKLRLKFFEKEIGKQTIHQTFERNVNMKNLIDDRLLVNEN